MTAPVLTPLRKDSPTTIGEVWRRARATVSLAVDPIARLMDPAFTDVLWEYEHSKIGEAIPGNLHPKQRAMLSDPAVHRFLFWGNQAGKTSLGAIDLVLSALGRHPMQKAGIERMPPFNAWASALSWELWEKILLPELLTWIPVHRLIDAPPAHQKSLKRDILIRADNGKISRITGKSAEQGAGQYQSARIHKVWTDEEHPEEVWNELQPRLLRFGGRSVNTMTPLKGFTWVYHRIYEPAKIGAVPKERYAYSHAGIADNPAISPEALEELRAELKHNPSQLAARERGEFVRPIGAVYPAFSMESCGVDVPKEAKDLTPWMRAGKCYGHVDFGKWRFAFAFGSVRPDGTLVMLDEVFSQNESSDDRAKQIHDVLKKWKVPDDLLIWGDCAAPDELAELNASFERINSPYFVMAVDAAKKSRSAGVLRVENLLGRGGLKVRRGMGEDALWYQGRSVSSNGRPVRGSRWVWEMVNWQYPKGPDGKVQKDDPDDATADGADMMDGLRYLVMEWLGPVHERVVKKAPTTLERLAKEFDEMDRQETAARQSRGRSGSRYGSVLRQG